MLPRRPRQRSAETRRRLVGRPRGLEGVDAVVRNFFPQLATESVAKGSAA